MKNNESRDLKSMVKRYLAGEATAKEQAFLEAYFNRFDRGEDILDQLSDDEKLALRDRMEASILERISRPALRERRMLPALLKVAAAALVFMSVGVYVYRSLEPVPVVAIQDNPMVDVAPGGNKALLTLADGSRISLDDARQGTLTIQGNAVITKTDSGQVSYQVAGGDAAQAVGINTLETPRGGEYQVVLADGTRVWLNAETKLVYPTAFVGKERSVELTGEAYFEVAKNPSMPFKVKSGAQVVQVLGTHFNISAYADEAVIKTTLLEGSVSVETSVSARASAEERDGKILKPGQQSVFKDGVLAVAAVNTADVMAWRDGYFVFANDNLEGVMRKISRWYDIEIQYTGHVTKEAFVGSVSKFEKLSEVLSVLELTGMVHFKIEGRRVTVMP